MATPCLTSILGCMRTLQTKGPGILGTKRFLRKILLCAALGLFFAETCAAAQSGLDSNGRLCETSEDLPFAVASSRDPKAISDPSGVPAPLSFPIPKDIPGYKALDLPHNLRGTLPMNSMTPLEPSRPSKNVFWKQAFMESLLYTGIMHGFNVTTEAGTRDTLNGHWFQNYVRSVSELRGWSDSDMFMAPYVGHPLEGSIFGYIFRQNDGKYRNVQWGDGRDYFLSLVRSIAWSAVWHTQWKIGPMSEASIGNVMLHASPGFITLVDTPTLGAVTMIAEDAADRYLIIGLENRTSNRAMIILARSFLNPSRTFANIMAFQVPWRRDTRLALFRDSELRKELVDEYKNGNGEKPFSFVRQPSDLHAVGSSHTYPKEAPIELSAYPYYENLLGGGNCIGGGGSGAARINPSLQIVVEVNGCLVMGFPKYNESGDSLFYGAGPRWTPRASHRFSPYVEVLFGGRKVTYEVDNQALHAQLLKEWNDGDGALAHYPTRKDWSIETSSNGVSAATGGGVDVVISRPFAWRLINLQYTHTWMGDISTIRPQNGIRFTTEAVLRIGTW